MHELTQELRRPAPGPEVFTPTFSGVTEVGTVTKTGKFTPSNNLALFEICLLYTSDAADDAPRV